MIRIGFLLFTLLFFTQTLPAQQKMRLVDDWEFVKQDLGGIYRYQPAQIVGE
jgi:hypothetical protein